MLRPGIGRRKTIQLRGESLTIPLSDSGQDPSLLWPLLYTLHNLAKTLEYYSLDIVMCVLVHQILDLTRSADKSLFPEKLSFSPARLTVYFIDVLRI